MATTPLQISRKTWAAVEQMATGAIQAGAAPGRESGRGGAEGVILIRNDTGAKLDYRGIVGLKDIVTKPPEPGWEFSLQYIAVKPDPDKYAFAVAMEDISEGAAGFALAFGIHAVRVDMKNGNHQYAKAIKDQTAHLESCEAGPVRILWRAAASGECDALVQFPAPPPPPQLIPVILSKTGGDAGDKNSSCTFTYNVKAFPDDSGAETLASGLNPAASPSKYRRPSIGKMREADFGIAAFDKNGKAFIVWCNEVLVLKSCDDDTEN